MNTGISSQHFPSIYPPMLGIAMSGPWRPRELSQILPTHWEPLCRERRHGLLLVLMLLLRLLMLMLLLMVVMVLLLLLLLLLFVTDSAYECAREALPVARKVDFGEEALCWRGSTHVVCLGELWEVDRHG